jgi:hypothetical protein
MSKNAFLFLKKSGAQCCGATIAPLFVVVLFVRADLLSVCLLSVCAGYTSIANRRERVFTHFVIRTFVRILIKLHTGLFDIEPE